MKKKDVARELCFYDNHKFNIDDSLISNYNNNNNKTDIFISTLVPVNIFWSSNNDDW